MLRLWAHSMLYYRLETISWCKKIRPEVTGNDRKCPLFKKRSFWTLQLTSGWLFTHQQVVSGPLYDIIKAQRRRICQNSKKFDPKIFF